jgi:hypothetical protein
VVTQGYEFQDLELSILKPEDPRLSGPFPAPTAPSAFPVSYPHGHNPEPHLPAHWGLLVEGSLERAQSSCPSRSSASERLV